MVAAAWVDDALLTYLQAGFYQDNDLIDDVIRADGPLGTFSARIKIAHLLGLLDSYAFKDLEIIRGIRNEFAHFRHDIRFTDQSIKDRCKNLHAAKAFQLGLGTNVRSPREMYILSAYFLAQDFLSLAEETTPARLPQRDYGAPIRRFAKSIALENIVIAIESQKQPR